jgi:hypothetical protein
VEAAMSKVKQTQKNPFQITSPEDMSAEDAMSLFVEVYTDFPKIIDPGHVFLIGPRGSGKSMMFRYLMPDCQCLKNKCALKDLSFLGIYVPLKNTNFALAELHRLENKHASDVLNSHLLTTHFALLAFKVLKELTVTNGEPKEVESTRRLFDECFIPLVQRASWNSSFKVSNQFSTVAEVFAAMERISGELYTDVINYAKRLSFHSEVVPYEGALCDYLDFLYPLFCAMRRLPYMPKGPIYLLIDDAHNLSPTQAAVLNSWVATRTSSNVSLKISTQPGYETYFTTSGSTIDTPHDFSEVNISTIYTGSRKTKYRDRVADVVRKRLALAKIHINPKEFFPEDKKQEDAIRNIGEQYREKHKRGEGIGSRPSDDAVRYARPDYIRSLAGQHKASSSYNYAGFDQLVHLSSGVIRHFIEPAHRMFSETVAKYPSKPVGHIRPGIQSDVSRDEAERFLFDDLEKIEKDKSGAAPPGETVRKLSNLIHGLGGMFRQCLLSDRSERRVFSIAFSDMPRGATLEVLDLGVKLGYFHRSTIGRKDSQSGGRTRLYILSRRLAPNWNLDPTGFAGYLFVTNERVEEAMREPLSLLRRLESKGLDADMQPGQLTLF